MDEKLKKALSKLIEEAKILGFVTYEDLTRTFEPLHVSEKDMDTICEELAQNGIIIRSDEDADDIIADGIDDMEEEGFIAELESAEESDQSLAKSDAISLYLADIRTTHLLTIEEEQSLARKVILGKEARLENVTLEEELQCYDDEEVRKRLQAKYDANLKLIDEGGQARKELINSNLRLTISIAKHYMAQGMDFLDFIQEGNIGLMSAIDRFDPEKGFKLSTYATWWIRQAITRSIADQARTIRLPVHLVDTINRVMRTKKRLSQEYGREVDAEDISADTGIDVKKIEEIFKIVAEPISLNTTLGEDSDTCLGDMIQDETRPDPETEAMHTMLQEKIAEILYMTEISPRTGEAKHIFTQRERNILTWRFGLDGAGQRTLEECGDPYGITRERVRQIESKVLKKLRSPKIASLLRSFNE